MINAVFKQGDLKGAPAPEVKNRERESTEKAKNIQDRTVTSEDVKKDQRTETEEAMEKIVNTAKFFNREIKLEIENELDIMIVKVVDRDTEEVIRQIPPKELVELSKNAKDLKGLLIDREG